MVHSHHTIAAEQAQGTHVTDSRETGTHPVASDPMKVMALRVQRHEPQYGPFNIVLEEVPVEVFSPSTAWQLLKIHCLPNLLTSFMVMFQCICMFVLFSVVANITAAEKNSLPTNPFAGLSVLPASRKQTI